MAVTKYEIKQGTSDREIRALTDRYERLVASLGSVCSEISRVKSDPQNQRSKQVLHPSADTPEASSTWYHNSFVWPPQDGLVLKPREGHGKPGRPVDMGSGFRHPQVKGYVTVDRVFGPNQNYLRVDVVDEVGANVVVPIAGAMSK